MMPTPWRCHALRKFIDARERELAQHRIELARRTTRERRRERVFLSAGALVALAIVCSVLVLACAPPHRIDAPPHDHGLVLIAPGPGGG